MVRDLTQGKPLSRILGFCVPLLIGNLFLQFYTITDGVIVGQYLGVQAFAAVGSTAQLNGLILGFALGVCSALSVPIAQYFGAGDVNALRRVEAHGIYLILLIALVLGTIMSLLSRPLLELFQTPERILDEAHRYISTVFAGAGASLLFSLLIGYMRALGDSRTPLFCLIVACLANVLLDLLFIAVFHMGVDGAAWATILSQLIAAGMCVAAIRKHFPMLYLTRADARPSLHELRKLSRVALPMGFQFALTAVGALFIQTAVNRLGYDAVAAVSAAGKLQNVLILPLDASGIAIAAFVSQNHGAKRYDRILAGVRQASLVFALYSVFAFGVCFLLGPTFAEIFVKRQEVAIHALIRQALLINAYFYLSLSVVYIYRNALQGFGHSSAVMTAGLMEMIGRCFVAWMLAAPFGYLGLCFASPMAWSLAGLFMLPMYAHTVKKLGKPAPLT